MNKIKKWTSKREYKKARTQHLNFLKKTYALPSNIEEGVLFWEKRNILEVEE